MLKKIQGAFFFILGYMLSPLSWWNDLFFNLPIAYLFGYIFSLLNPHLFLPFTIIGYWLSNILGILMMQFGVADIFMTQHREKNLKKDLVIGLSASTAYTILIVALLQLKWIETPNFLLSSFN
jgi:hypothetical protein